MAIDRDQIVFEPDYTFVHWLQCSVQHSVRKYAPGQYDVHRIRILPSHTESCITILEMEISYINSQRKYYES